MKQFALLVVFISALRSLPAQVVTEQMTADRPGFRNSTHLVGRGVVQFESGFRFFNEREEGQGNIVASELDLRAGATNWLEFRLRADRVVFRSPRASVDLDQPAGISDLQAGIKFPIIDIEPGTRLVAILGTSVPTGHSSQTSGGYEPTAQLIWEQELDRNNSFAGTFNLTRLKLDRFVWQKAASLAYNRSLGESTRVFGEAYVVSPSESLSGNRWVFNAGGTRQIGDYLMVDISAGHSLHRRGEWFAMVGFALRSRVPRPKRNPID